MLEDYISAGTLPDDLVDVSEDIYHQYIEAPPEGKTRGANAKGMPAWIASPKPVETPEAAENKRYYLLLQAQNTISIWQTELQLGVISEQDKASLTTWVAYIQQLRAVDTSKSDIIWPDIPAII
jgi:hypothetical protein